MAIIITMDPVGAQTRQLLQDAFTQGSVNLNLAKRALKDVPDEIGMLTILETLSLSMNAISSLPSSMSSMISLRYINLKSNALREFPAVLCDMPALEILDISRNKIRSLPDQPGVLLKLRVWSIARNRIAVLPKLIASMPCLEVLMLEHNPLQWPPPLICNMATGADPVIWLTQLKDYIRKEVPPRIIHHSRSNSEVSSISESSNPTLNSSGTVSLSTTPIATPGLQNSSSFSNSAQIPLLQGRSAHLPSVTLSDPPEVPRTTFLHKSLEHGIPFVQPHEPASRICSNIVPMYLSSVGPAQTHLVSAARSIATAAARLYATTRGGIALIASTATFSFNDELSRLNAATMTLITALEGLEAVNTAGSVGGGNSNESVRVAALDVVRICRVVAFAVVDSRNGIGGNSSIIQNVCNGVHVDQRLLRSWAIAWFEVNVELSAALEVCALGFAMNGGTGPLRELVSAAQKCSDLIHQRFSETRTGLPQPDYMERMLSAADDVKTSLGSVILSIRSLQAGDVKSGHNSVIAGLLEKCIALVKAAHVSGLSKSNEPELSESLASVVTAAKSLAIK